MARVKKGMKRVNVDIPVSLHTAMRVEAIEKHMRFGDLVVERLGGSPKTRIRSRKVRKVEKVEAESIGSGEKL